ncbi:MAG TPA: CDP-alcohol phosphatidyltransferase family protein [Gemmatimonadales bacterium]|jgi:phosphatidylglycerophosphate synthase
MTFDPISSMQPVVSRLGTITSGNSSVVKYPMDAAAAHGFALTFIKLPLALIISLAILASHTWTAVAGIALIVVVDIFDGVVFGTSIYRDVASLRRSRRVLDAVTDRVIIGGVALALAFSGALPAIALAVVVAREVVLISLVTVPFYRDRTIRKPNLISRTATATGGLIAISCLVLPSGTLPALAAYGVLSILGFALYVVSPTFEDR